MSKISAVLIKLFSVFIFSQSWFNVICIEQIKNVKIRTCSCHMIGRHVVTSKVCIEMTRSACFPPKQQQKSSKGEWLAGKFDWRRTDTSPLLNKMTLGSRRVFHKFTPELISQYLCSLILTANRIDGNTLERGFVEYLADPAIRHCLWGHLCNLGMH
jgi:hypothetical protein